MSTAPSAFHSLTDVVFDTSADGLVDVKVCAAGVACACLRLRAAQGTAEHLPQSEHRTLLDECRIWGYAVLLSGVHSLEVAHRLVGPRSVHSARQARRLFNSRHWSAGILRCVGAMLRCPLLSTRCDIPQCGCCRANATFRWLERSNPNQRQNKCPAPDVFSLWIDVMSLRVISQQLWTCCHQQSSTAS